MLITKPNNSLTILQNLFLMSFNWQKQMKLAIFFSSQIKSGSFNNVHSITTSHNGLFYVH